MTKLNTNTKKAQAIIAELTRNTELHSIYDAYDRPSDRKVASFTEIRERAMATPGYNHDLHVTGHNSSFYSTIYSYTVDGTTFVVKDTHADTYLVEL